MGYWDFQPRGGDGPLDLWFEVQEDALVRLFQRKVRDSYELWDRIGAFQIILESGFLYVSKKVIDAIIDDCLKLIKDDEFIEAWKDPEAIRAVLDDIVDTMSTLKTNLPAKRPLPYRVVDHVNFEDVMGRRKLLSDDVIRSFRKREKVVAKKAQHRVKIRGWTKK